MSFTPDLRRALSSSSAIVAALTLSASLVVGSTARAQVQTSAQQACLNTLYRSAAKVGQAQGRLNRRCLKAQQVFAPERLGNPDQERTVDACLTNDTLGSVAKAGAAVVATEANFCTTDPPSFGAGTGVQIAGAASSQSRAV